MRFLGEQDGPTERLLKDRLVRLFHDGSSVDRAYLARVDSGSETSVNVVLGLRTPHGVDKSLVEQVGSIFALIFSGSEHLDIVFLMAPQEAELSKVCNAFFEEDMPPCAHYVPLAVLVGGCICGIRRCGRGSHFRSWR